MYVCEEGRSESFKGSLTIHSMNQPKTFSSSSSPLLLPLLPYTAPCLPSQKPWFSAHCQIAWSNDRYQSRYSVKFPSPLQNTKQHLPRLWVLLGKRGMDDGWIRGRYTRDTVYIYCIHIHWMYTQYLYFNHSPRISAQDPQDIQNISANHLEFSNCRQFIQGT